jgi:hypothetical protein
MAEKGNLSWCIALMLAACAIPYLARPAPVLAGAVISSDVIGAAGGQATSTSFAIHDTFGQGPIGPVAVDDTIRLYDGFWSALAEAEPDTTPPDTLITFEATALDESVFLEWLVPMDPDLSGTLIMYKTTGFPTGPDDGTPVENGASGRFPAGMGQSFTHSNLTNQTTYCYAAFDYDASDNFSAGLTDSATPFDGLAPGPLTSFTAVAGDSSVVLSWTNPSDADFDHTVIRYSTADYPTDPTDGLPVDGVDGEFPNSPGTSEQFTHAGLDNGTTYYYSAFAADEVPNYSVESEASAAPADIYPPGDFDMVAISEEPDGSVMLRWKTPADNDIEGVLIRYDIGSVPITTEDGEPVPNGSNGIFDTGPAEMDTFYHRGLVSDTTYYYSLWSFDEVPNYSEKRSMSARPHDETPPELALTVFQNPYLTTYLDIYLIGSEALTDTSIYCSMEAYGLAMEVTDSDENVWIGNHQVDSTGTMSVYAMARDISLNWAEVTHVFSSTLILKAGGGIARSPDGRLSIAVPGGGLKRDTYVLISEDDQATPEITAAYRISPPGADLEDFAEISIAYGEEAGPPENLTIARLEPGDIIPVSSYVDRANGRLVGFVDQLGTYGLMWDPDRVTPEYGSGDFRVFQNVPNPFAGATGISFVLPRAGRVRADIIAIDGRLVARICDRFMIPGRHTIDWDSRDSNGGSVASGVYFYRVRFGSETVTKKMVRLR